MKFALQPVCVILLLSFSPAAHGQEPNEESAGTVADQAYYEALNNLGDPKHNHFELLAQFEKVSRLQKLAVREKPALPEGAVGLVKERRYPHTGDIAFVNQAIPILKRMVADEDERRRHPPRPEKEMNKQELIAELIYCLRHQKGYSSGFVGPCDIFNDVGPGMKAETGRSPAHRLVEMEYEAVPQLLEALENDRFTRSIENPLRGINPMRPLRVGDCALAILERIAARKFYLTRSVREVTGAENRKEVHAWWREFCEKGERMMLIEGTIAGDDNSRYQVKGLLERHPDAAVFALNKGIRNCKDCRIRCELLSVADELHGDVLVTLFRDELKGTMLACRLLAAESLLKRGHSDGVAAMIADWKKVRRRDAETTERLGHGRRSLEADLAAFLARCGQKEAVEALFQNLSTAPRDRRMDIITALKERSSLADETSLSPEVQKIMDRILFSSLDDREEEATFAFMNKGMPVTPRVCDIAARQLCEAWRMRALFDIEAPLTTRNQQILEVKNLWLKKHGKPALPLPK
jgi:hypothetical protein